MLVKQAQIQHHHVAARPEDITQWAGSDRLRTRDYPFTIQSDHGNDASPPCIASHGASVGLYPDNNS